MKEIGGDCAFASEINPAAREVYFNNFGMMPTGDITKIKAKDIPKHNMLCAGFPCQPFSKAGKRNGIKDPRGNLFFEIIRIASYHKPEYILLENVRNLLSHDNGETWKTIQYYIDKIGYNCPKTPVIFSPHYIGIPQFRERVFILCKRKDMGKVKTFVFSKSNIPKCNIENILQKDDEIENPKKYRLLENEISLIELWNDFLKINKNKLPGFPIWSEYLNDNLNIDSFDKLPKWKQRIIQKNQYLYIENRKTIDLWLTRAKEHPLFYGAKAKFEWQAGKNHKGDIWDTIMQFRPSGLRVKAPTYFPALVAINHTSIIGRLKRRITPREAARLQSFPNSFHIHRNDRVAYRQFGNAVNVKLATIFGAYLLFHQTITSHKFKIYSRKII